MILTFIYFWNRIKLFKILTNRRVCDFVWNDHCSVSLWIYQSGVKIIEWADIYTIRSLAKILVNQHIWYGVHHRDCPMGLKECIIAALNPLDHSNPRRDERISLLYSSLAVAVPVVTQTNNDETSCPKASLRRRFLYPASLMLSEVNISPFYRISFSIGAAA